MPEPLHRRMYRQMQEKTYGGAVNAADWTWLVLSLSDEQKERIEAQAAEHGCSMLAVLERWPELFDKEAL